MYEHFDVDRRRPEASVIIPNHNGADRIASAIRSALRQTLGELEVIVSDDASTDRSVEIVQNLMQGDSRIRLLTSEVRCGSAAARNRALEVAAGRWIAIIDAEGIMHPARLETLLSVAIRDRADIVADDILFFTPNHRSSPKPLLSERMTRTSFWIDIRHYLRANSLFRYSPMLRNLRPVFNASCFSGTGLRYETRLGSGLDYALMLGLLEKGYKFRVCPLLLYFCTATRHLGLDVEEIEGLKAATSELGNRTGRSRSELTAAIEEMMRSLEAAGAYREARYALIERKWLKAATIIVSNPITIRLLRRSVSPKLTERPKTSRPSVPRRQICVISRQRVVGRITGSANYLLDVVSELAKHNVDAHLVVPSPNVLGRWPYLSMSHDMAVFKSIRIRGTFQIGSKFISLNLALIFRAGFAVLDRFLIRLGVSKNPFSKRAPYAVIEHLTRKDQLFIARHAATVGDVLIADYCFLAEAFPYALRPESKRIIVMHELFSGLSSQGLKLGRIDPIVNITEAEELRKLAHSDTIVAIQNEDAEVVRRALPTHRVLVAPISAKPVDFPQAGRRDLVVFVGSWTAANVDGIRWFIEHCWSQVRSVSPSTTLCVAGRVSAELGPPPEGVSYLGFVQNLESLYRDAGVIISPLRFGTGLKVKLIEALQYGKAVVATSATLQGMEHVLGPCVEVQDSATAFAAAVSKLLEDGERRAALGAKALLAARQHLSASVCYRELVGDVLTGARE